MNMVEDSLISNLGNLREYDGSSFYRFGNVNSHEFHFRSANIGPMFIQLKVGNQGWPLYELGAISEPSKIGRKKLRMIKDFRIFCQ
jgi:hypothetical protein